MAEAPTSHVQVKGDLKATAMVSPTRPLGPLAPDSVRVRSSILCLSTNTTTYAVAGSVLHWWDTFPVTDALPPPFNDRAKYGIAPSWGFATVLESAIPEILVGSTIRGFLPLSSVAVDLRLQAGGVPGHWIENSEHRAAVMSTYQRYVVSPNKADAPTARDAMGLDALVGTLWGSTWLLNKYSFGTTAPFIHPGGAGQPWSAADADLSNATAIILTASSKTAMALAHELRHGRSAGSGPRKLIGVTSATNRSFVQQARWHDEVLSYDEAQQAGDHALAATATANSSRIVVFDYGARGEFAVGLHTALAATGIPTTFVRVGTEKKAGPPEEQMRIFQRGAALGMVQMNASGLRDQLLAELGENEIFQAEAAARDVFLARGGIPGLKLRWSQGMRGSTGLEGAWEHVAGNEVPADEGVVVWVDAKIE